MEEFADTRVELEMGCMFRIYALAEPEVLISPSLEKPGSSSHLAGRKASSEGKPAYWLVATGLSWWNAQDA